MARAARIILNTVLVELFISHLLCHATSEDHLDTCLKIEQLHTSVVKEAVTSQVV